MAKSSLAILSLLAFSSLRAVNSECGSGPIHNFIFGNRVAGDSLAQTYHEVMKSKWMQVVSRDVVFPLAGTMTEGVINRVEVLDQLDDGNGGCAYIVSGGIGYQNLTLHLKSKRNYGFDFVIYVYEK